MKRLMLPGLICAAVIAFAAGVMQLHSRPIGGSVAGTQSSQVARATSDLPVEDFDDRSLVFPRETRK
ncbi:hypothetical protein JQ625_17230 [Bradyrhizobium diazoefficiens]|nr:hypothetical protein [Bradyrhizobium diazoefficiens]MBR0776582.1 hypothetical protein [Bradyrhizobium diazoefficiens]